MDGYGYMTINELRGVYQASGGDFGGYMNDTGLEILEILTERFTYDADYYGVVGDPAVFAKDFLRREGPDR
jgi:hypothetical protein